MGPHELLEDREGDQVAVRGVDLSQEIDKGVLDRQEDGLLGVVCRRALFVVVVDVVVVVADLAVFLLLIFRRRRDDRRQNRPLSSRGTRLLLNRFDRFQYIRIPPCRKHRNGRRGCFGDFVFVWGWCLNL